MSDPIDPGKLLRQARRLAGFGAGPGRPNPTDHRRAVSAAYYALFHGINLATVRHALPPGTPDEEVRHATRWINHRDVYAVSDAVSACAAPRSPIIGLPRGLSARAGQLWAALSAPHEAGGRVSVVPLDLRFVANTCRTLQGARQSADYDHLVAFPKATATRCVQDAAYALDRLDANSEDPFFQRFFAWILARATAFAT